MSNKNRYQRQQSAMEFEQQQILAQAKAKVEASAQAEGKKVVWTDAAPQPAAKAKKSFGKRIKSFFKKLNPAKLFTAKKSTKVGVVAKTGRRGTTIRQRIAARKTQTSSAIRRTYHAAVKAVKRAWNYVAPPVRKTLQVFGTVAAIATGIMFLVAAPFQTLAVAILGGAAFLLYGVAQFFCAQSDNETVKFLGTVLLYGYKAMGLALELFGLVVYGSVLVAQPAVGALLLMGEVLCVIGYNERLARKAAIRQWREERQAVAFGPAMDAVVMPFAKGVA